MARTNSWAEVGRCILCRLDDGEVCTQCVEDGKQLIEWGWQ
ncbi:hypothetical protein SEA_WILLIAMBOONE_117 [Gordonia phage WilliamBoone]|nr:hypothetical protein SEA_WILLIAMBOONE_117 [Gordonia phage WilliamBoone]